MGHGRYQQHEAAAMWTRLPSVPCLLSIMHAERSGAGRNQRLIPHRKLTNETPHSSACKPQAASLQLPDIIQAEPRGQYASISHRISLIHL